MTGYNLEVNGLYGGIGDFELRDVNLKIERGTVMGLIGKNGAGKTTLIQTIAGLLPRYSGAVLFDGLPMAGNEVVVKNKIGVVLDFQLFQASSKPRKAAKMLSHFYDNFDMERFFELMERFDLPVDKKLARLSKGMKSAFNIVMALCHDPDLVIMDEPTAGLDPEKRRDIIDILHEFVQDEGKSVLFSTHITSDLERIADHITLIDDGRTVFTKSVIEITDEMALCRISREELTEGRRPFVVGLRETSLGLECLVRDKSAFSGIEGIQFSRPTIEDLLTHRMEG
jgi:ABC-2 type transport system ATP-binding protein